MRKRIEPPVCVALDARDLAGAMAVVEGLGSSVSVFKVGLELFAAQGPRVVEEILSRGAEVFLDLKVNDIPNQAAGAVRAARDIGVGYLTVHGNAGRASVEAAVEAAEGGSPKILVVSVLTSLDEPALKETGVSRPVSAQVQAMADLAVDTGAPGLVLSAKEVGAVREEHDDLFLVTPGIRPAASEAGDQKRVGTPSAAVAAGADLLVIGRPITAAADPAAALRAILDEIAQATTKAST
ncbi:MAG: orotidine-5'-phosphate decarboxylase [Actinomycetota bacterium]